MSIEACQWGSAHISNVTRQGGHSYRHKGNVRVDFIAIGLVAAEEAKANVKLLRKKECKANITHSHTTNRGSDAVLTIKPIMDNNTERIEMPGVNKYLCSES